MLGSGRARENSFSTSNSYRFIVQFSEEPSMSGQSKPSGGRRTLTYALRGGGIALEDSAKDRLRLSFSFALIPAPSRETFFSLRLQRFPSTKGRREDVSAFTSRRLGCGTPAYSTHDQHVVDGESCLSCGHLGVKRPDSRRSPSSPGNSDSRGGRMVRDFVGFFQGVGLELNRRSARGPREHPPGPRSAP